MPLRVTPNIIASCISRVKFSSSPSNLIYASYIRNYIFSLSPSNVIYASYIRNYNAHIKSGNINDRNSNLVKN